MSFTGPGPRIARVYLRVLALCTLFAWLSLGSQIVLLVGTRGLLPIGSLLDAARGQVAWHRFPTLLWLWSSDRALVSAVALGAASSLYGALRPCRAWLFFALPLYLSVSLAAQDFCGFQWDFLLVESCGVALLLDPDRPARAALWIMRLLCVKLYFESGLSKALSPVGDWLSGSAMVAYFETAPLPMPLARAFHALPLSVLHVASWLTLFIELVVPLFAFGPRRVRLVAFVLLTAFQLMNALTANYGFFVPLAVALHLFLLDDDMLPRWVVARGPLPAPRWASISATVALAVWTVASLLDATLLFGNVEAPALLAIHDAYEGFRVVGTYHLFASVTTERIEPTLEVRIGDSYTELALHDKPGPVYRGLPIVQPHQPRVDFQLWFHGLSPAHLPRYLERLEALLCDEPSRVAALFVAPPPPHADAVRIRYYRYRFTPPGADETWTRTLVYTRPEHTCGATEETGQR